jgi:hypothetical protein
MLESQRNILSQAFCCVVAVISSIYIAWNDTNTVECDLVHNETLGKLSHDAEVCLAPSPRAIN